MLQVVAGGVTAVVPQILPRLVGLNKQVIHLHHIVTKSGFLARYLKKYYDVKDVTCYNWAELLISRTE